LDRLRRWKPFSTSSPVEGITHAIRTYSTRDRKISLYVLGDEFTGKSIDNVVETVARINRVDREGNRLVRIHGVGFPTMFSQAGFSENTGIRFATLMRLLCEKNGGAFVRPQLDPPVKTQESVEIRCCTRQRSKSCR
jgi:hypothetical protein